MSDDSEQIADMMRDGTYFDEARRWYRAIYIGPVSERTFFLLVAFLAGLVAFFSLIAFMEFLPVTEHPALLLHNDRIEDSIPHLVTIMPERTPINAGLMHFFVETYVNDREGYNPQTYVQDFNFIHAHSDAPTYDSYAAVYGSNNPQSPAAILGDTAGRFVTVTGIEINDKVDPHKAVVHFTTELAGVDSPSRTRWTAAIQFYYSNLVATPGTDPDTHKSIITTTDPQFQVVNYVLTQEPASAQ